MSTLTDKHPGEPALDWVNDDIVSRALKCAMYLDLLGVITNEQHREIHKKLSPLINKISEGK